MIVRINQIDPARIDVDGGWSAGRHAGSFRAAWPAEFRAFELLILSEDERRQPLTDAFRQQQLRQMIPQAAIALTPVPARAPTAAASTGAGPAEAGPATGPDTPVVVRLDGTIAGGELLSAWRHLTEPDGRGRFAFSPSAKLDDPPTPPTGSVRVAPSWRLLSQICGDPDLGLERSVRLRLMAVAARSMPAVLDASDTDDSRWPQLLNDCQLYVGTTRGLGSLHILVRLMDAAQVKARVMQRLMAVARGEPAIPG